VLNLYGGVEGKDCKVCGEVSLISEALGVCVNCIRERWEEAKSYIKPIHRESRIDFGLPHEPPKSRRGVQCNQCVHRCVMGDGEVGFCGTKKNIGGKIKHIYGVNLGLLDWYYDPIPTNCVAEWVCGARGRGYPRYSVSKGTEYGRKNLAVFYRACTLNCLFCQNWHFKEGTTKLSEITADELAEAVDGLTTCICYFGGDPTPQIHHTFLVAKKARRDKKVLRICWETNGSMNPQITRKMGEVALESGGTIKIDLKAWNRNLHIALTSASNEWAIENIRLLSEMGKKRREPPLLVVSTLLVPGYLDEVELDNIANFLSSLDPEIPLSLLAFYPHFLMHDLPRTSKAHADMALNITRSKGLKEVKIGNAHLLW
jgi:pyruvate formate lyase activating enzyme